jgi:hypothetical protein
MKYEGELYFEVSGRNVRLHMHFFSPPSKLHVHSYVTSLTTKTMPVEFCKTFINSTLLLGKL